MGVFKKKAQGQLGTILAKTSMGKMTLDEAKMSPELDAGAKGIKEGRQLGGPTKSTGSVFYAGPDREEHQK